MADVIDADQRTSTEDIRDTESILPTMKQLPGCEESDANEVNQWVNFDKGGKDYSDSDIVAYVRAEDVYKRQVYTPPDESGSLASFTGLKNCLIYLVGV